MNTEYLYALSTIPPTVSHQKKVFVGENKTNIDSLSKFPCRVKLKVISDELARLNC